MLATPSSTPFDIPNSTTADPLTGPLTKALTMDSPPKTYPGHELSTLHAVCLLLIQFRLYAKRSLSPHAETAHLSISPSPVPPPLTPRPHTPRRPPLTFMLKLRCSEVRSLAT